MEYQRNESGDIKVMDAKGNVKWFSEALVKDAVIMRKEGYEPVPMPLCMEFNNNVAETVIAENDGKKSKK